MPGAGLRVKAVPGVSVWEASRRLRISRNTASKWLAKPEMKEPKYPDQVKAV